MALVGDSALEPDPEELKPEVEVEPWRVDIEFGALGPASGTASGSGPSTPTFWVIAGAMAAQSNRNLKNNGTILVAEEWINERQRRYEY